MHTKRSRKAQADALPVAPAVPLEERLSYRCSLIATRITRFLVPMLEERYGLTVITWRVMAVIGRYAPLSAKKIAAHTSTDAFFVFRAVEQLVGRGYVIRNVDPRDRRRSSLQLSATGLAAHRSIETVINRVEAQVLSGLDPFERDALSAVLAHLNDSCTRLLEGAMTWRDFAA